MLLILFLIIRKQFWDDSRQKRWKSKNWEISRRAQVRPGHEWGAEKDFSTFFAWVEKRQITYSDTILYPATISAQRRRSQICVNEPRQSSWSIFDASSDPTPPPPLESSRESTNFLRDHFSFALNFLFARLWKSESLKGVKSDQECGTGDCHAAAAAAA